MLTRRSCKVDFSWLGDGGYSASGFFTWNSATAPTTIGGVGSGPTTGLDALHVDLFSPGPVPLLSVDTVVAGESFYPTFFSFAYDTSTNMLVDARTAFGALEFFDVGQDNGNPDDTWLRTDSNPDPTLDFLILRSRDSGGSSSNLDTGGPLEISDPTTVPEPTTLLLLGLGLAGLGFARRG